MAACNIEKQQLAITCLVHPIFRFSVKVTKHQKNQLSCFFFVFSVKILAFCLIMTSDFFLLGHFNKKKKKKKKKQQRNELDNNVANFFIITIFRDKLNVSEQFYDDQLRLYFYLAIFICGNVPLNYYLEFVAGFPPVDH